MQFVTNGPDIPERLLQAHEDGRVVFFCGAGISYPAGLPDFAGLVKKLYERLSGPPDAEQRAAIRTRRFDTAIALLENKIVGGREAVRRELANILTPNFEISGATATHEALLTLSRNREERTRLVTTNFDRLFEKVIDDAGLSVALFQAPLLPVPKSRWDGLVYLHGLLPAKKPSAQELDRLVFSSGDFGLAYLIDGWAARFVGELFRNYTVCFVGYSLDDPVLRYMTDALVLGESPREMFAFGSHSKCKEKEQTGHWQAKNVTPILYREHRRHSYLHGTLREWAAAYRDGIGGKEQIVARYAGLRPSASTKQDDFVGRLLWALNDPGGLPAKRFAGHDPVPSLDWLEYLGEQRYGRADLGRFGVMPHADEDDKLEFSLIRRPSPYTRAPWMTLMDESVGIDGWDDVMRHLACWLLRHLDDPKLLLWLAERGGQLHPGFIRLIEWRLEELDKLEGGGDTDGLDRIRSNAPRAVPGPAMRTLWRLMLAGRMKSPSSTLDIYQWRPRFERDGLTIALRLELRHLLTPRISLRGPSLLGGDREDRSEPERVGELVDWEIVLSSDHVHSALPHLRESPRWPEALPGLLDDLNALLRDAMDLMRELGGADDESDPSWVHQPSIEAHPQNDGGHDWTALIELTRDAWTATVKVAPERARLAAEAWRLAGYPVFRRLALFAATHRGVIPPRQALDWLLIDERWWLWSPATQRESMRLLVFLSTRLTAPLLIELEQAVLPGPRRDMFKADIGAEDWTGIVEREVWLRLAKMKEAGASLGTDARAKFDQLTSRHPDWRLQEEDRDEFPFWTEDGVIVELQRHVAIPRRRRDLVEWLKQNPGEGFWQEDGWSQRCRDDFPTTACALCALARDGTWPPRRWHKALRAWSEEDLIERSWRYMAPVLAAAPDDVLQSLARDVGGWLENVAKISDPDETMFLDLCRRILKLNDRGDADKGIGGPLTQAINHPVGRVTEALLHWWSRNPLEDEQGLPDELKPIFTGLCDTDVGKFRHGRVLMAVRVIPLFRVDREWTAQHVLPLFEWHRSEDEARAVWEGFLWSPRLYRPLMESIRQPFLATAHRYEALGHCSRQYATLLASVSFDRGNTFTMRELAAATAALPEEGLRHTTDLLARTLDGLVDRHAEYWRNRVLPYLKKIWPQSRDRKTPAISEGLGRVCIAAGNEFPAALEALRPWLQPLPFPGHLIRRLKKSGRCNEFPEHALAFLALVAGDGSLWGSGLKECLEQIQSAASELKEDRRFQTLWDRLRQSGQELE